MKATLLNKKYGNLYIYMCVSHNNNSDDDDDSDENDDDDDDMRE